MYRYVGFGKRSMWSLFISLLSKHRIKSGSPECGVQGLYSSASSSDSCSLSRIAKAYYLTSFPDYREEKKRRNKREKSMSGVGAGVVKWRGERTVGKVEKECKHRFTNDYNFSQTERK